MREPQQAGSETENRQKARLRPPARLKKRADFLDAAKGRRAHGAAFTLQAVRRGAAAAAADPPRFGFTVTKKLGGAVLRNRIRRRLKEALRLSPDLLACPGYDYVIVGRPAALTQEFTRLKDDLARAIAEVHARPARPRPQQNARRPSVCANSKTKD